MLSDTACIIWLMAALFYRNDVGVLSTLADFDGVNRRAKKLTSLKINFSELTHSRDMSPAVCQFSAVCLW